MKYFILFIIASNCALSKPYDNRRLLVRYKNTNTQAHINSKRLFKVVPGLQLIEVADGVDTQHTIETLKSDPNVTYVEHDYEVHTSSLPNDPMLSSQWALNNIHVPQAWDMSIGDSNVFIGVIDTGVDYKHPDLVANLWTNPREIAGNRVDDDHNGIIDDVYGANMIRNTGDPLDDSGHGSHVTGIIAASGNNGIGISGVMQKAKIISCKFLDKDGSGAISGAISCLEYFSNLHIPIVTTNNSWGGNNFSMALYDAILAHQHQGILFVTAAGNYSVDHDQTPLYPASYDLANVISVAAIDDKENLADFSDYGRYSIHVAAPGVDILSTTNGSYANMKGTSIAAPHVSGLAGLIKTQKNTRDWVAIKNLILSGGKSLSSLSDRTITGKLIQADGSLNCIEQYLRSHVLPHSNALSLEIGQSIPLSAYNIKCDKSLGDRVIQINHQNTLLTNKDGICTSSFKPNSTGIYTVNFGFNDIASIDIFDSSQWKNYVTATPITFQYRNISGKSVETGDETKSTISAPFALLFGAASSGIFQLYVSSNGALSLTDNLLSGFHNTSIPVVDRMTLIAPLWSDLFADGSNSGIFYDTVGSTPNREFVVEWRNMQKHGLADSLFTFQIIFFENKSDILFNYLSIKPNISATIGIQVKPTLSLQYNSPVKSGLSLLLH